MNLKSYIIVGQHYNWVAQSMNVPQTQTFIGIGVTPFYIRQNN